MVLKTDCRDDYKDCQSYVNDKFPCKLDDRSICGWCPRYEKPVSNMHKDIKIQEIRYTENPNKKVYNIDFDGTLTTGEYVDFPEANHLMTAKVKELASKGHVIIIWTARGWSQAPKLAAWLTLYSIPFHGIRMDKGGSDCYVDDKAVLIKDFLKD